MIVQEDGAAVPETPKATMAVGRRVHLPHIAGRQGRAIGPAALWGGAMAAMALRQEVE